MSLRINTNTSAQSAHRWMQANDTSMAKSIERLSSGFRINSAADDAAGLVISESLRTQISGLGVASTNTQSAINVIKTTEKALDEITTQLRTIRDLSLNASNSNGNATQIAADQAQVNKALSAIDRIADQTEFAGMKLLSSSTSSGSIEGAVFQIGANAGQTATFNATGTMFGSTALTTDMHTNTGLGFTTTAGAYAKAASATNFATLATGDSENFNVVWQKADGTTDQFQFTVTAAADIDTAAKMEDAINAQLATAGYDGKLEATDDGANHIQIGVVDRLENIGEQNGNSKISVSSESPDGAFGAQFGFTPISGSGTTASAGITLSATTDYTTLLGDIQDAMDKVNGLRVNLGAFQKNTLESNLNSIAVTKENLSASESDIRDTDMADEMTTFTRAQILLQAGQAMMSQANQAPQSILQMLK